VVFIHAEILAILLKLAGLQRFFSGRYALASNKAVRPYAISGRTAGKKIKTKEIRLAPPLFLQTIEDTGFSTWLRESESPFAFYFILLFHTFGLALLVGANMVVDLRLLGFARGVPLAPLKRLFSIMWIGFAMNAVTGVFLVIAYPTKSLTNPDFYVKLTVIGLALWVMWRIRSKVFEDASLNETEMMERGAALAKWSLILWFGAITAGRLLAYTYKYLTFPS
jgi:hypothetical protein